MDRVILHSDINSCYASIEHVFHPELRDVPLAVAGSAEERHGIILAKDEAAKKSGVKTGMAIWQAKQVCPQLALVEPRMDRYLLFSEQVQAIYSEYTDLREPFGIDESWLDLTGCAGGKDAPAAAREIGQRIKREMGVTVSVGVSWNKIFAKLGSDYRKPDAVTVISRENYREIVWPLPVEDLLCVGRATGRSLRAVGIRSIGELAAADPELLRLRLGKNGSMLQRFARGLDTSPVRHEAATVPVKSIGNSTTAPRDLCCEEDVRVQLLALAESVGMRMREAKLRGRCVCLAVRSSELQWRSRRTTLPRSVNTTEELFAAGTALYRETCREGERIRSLGLSISALEPANLPRQTDLFGTEARTMRQERLDSAMDDIRRKYGFGSVFRGLAALDPALGLMNAKDAHTVHPVGYLPGG